LLFYGTRKFMVTTMGTPTGGKFTEIRSPCISHASRPTP
jgi:hypothetical protein